MTNVPTELLLENVDRVWIDIEKTGLSDDDPILEVGATFGDVYGNVDHVFHSLVWHPKWHEKLNAADDIVKKMHRDSGLWTDLAALDADEERRRKYTSARVQDELLMWLTEFHMERGKLKLAGSSVHFDRGALHREMPYFERFFHYRNVDVSTIKETCRGLNPDLYARLEGATNPKKAHRPLLDLGDTLEEYRFYVNEFLMW